MQTSGIAAAVFAPDETIPVKSPVAEPRPAAPAVAQAAQAPSYDDPILRPALWICGQIVWSSLSVLTPTLPMDKWEFITVIDRSYGGIQHRGVTPFVQSRSTVLGVKDSLDVGSELDRMFAWLRAARHPLLEFMVGSTGPDSTLSNE